MEKLEKFTRTQLSMTNTFIFAIFAVAVWGQTFNNNSVIKIVICVFSHFLKKKCLKLRFVKL